MHTNLIKLSEEKLNRIHLEDGINMLWMRNNNLKLIIVNSKNMKNRINYTTPLWDMQKL